MSEVAEHRDAVRNRRGGLFLTRLRISNYKSIEKCDVEFRPLTMLVGRNGSGKSNFLDALRFVVDSLQTSVDHAIKWRGGIDSVRRRSTGHPRNFAIGLDFDLSDELSASYVFEIGSSAGGAFVVRQERLKVVHASGRTQAYFRVTDGEVEASATQMPPAARDRLYLVHAAGLPEFRLAYDALLAMGFYNLNPAAMKELQAPDAGELLHRDGANIASVVGRLAADQPDTISRIRSYLATIVPGIVGVARIGLGPRETIEFRQQVEGSKHPWRFYAASMSDVTLRALGTLVAVTQLAEQKQRVRLVGIEEPETALHPAAAGALIDALREAACHTQVIVTTHSPDLIDQIDSANDRLLAVQASEGNTQVGPVDAASQAAIRDHLYTPGELLRLDQLQIDRRDLERQRQLVLFDGDEGAP
jgi:predicted ATPase